MIARSSHAHSIRNSVPTVKRVTASPFDPLVQMIFPRLAELTPASITPNMVTVAGAGATVTAGVSLAFSGEVRELLLFAAALVIVNWMTDSLDGVLARQRAQCTGLGDFLDHVFDAVTAASLTVGPAFSGLVRPELTLLLGVILLLNFAITYKGEQVTGVYELLRFGPTEVRFVLAGVLVTTYFVPQPVVTAGGWSLGVLDVTCLGGMMWAAAYAVILSLRFARRLRD